MWWLYAYVIVVAVTICVLFTITLYYMFKP